MHRIASYSRKVMLRFRRWSRKEYAAFVSLHRHVTIGQVGRGIADASLGKQKTAVCEGKKTEGTSWTGFSEEDTLFGSGGPRLGGSLFEIDRTGLWCLLVSQREEVPALLLDKINKITITGRDVSAWKNGGQHPERPGKNQGNGAYGCKKNSTGGYSQ